MKKTISILLCAVMLCTLLPCFAAEKCDCEYTPVISVRGFGSTLYAVDEDGNEKNVFSYDAGEIAGMTTGLMGSLTALAAQKDYDGFVAELKDAVAIFADKLLCDENGDSVHKIVTHSEATDVDRHQGTNYIYFRGEEEHNNYVFEYDWRMSPLQLADELDTYIQQVKAVTGHDQVTLISHSEGNNVTASYFYKYGSQDIKKSIHLSAAFQGISIIGEAFTKRVDLADKGDGLQDFLTTILGTDEFYGFLNALVASLNRMGLLNSLLNGISDVFDKTLEQMYAEILIDTFATMPAMWSFVPNEYYEEAKATMLGDDEKYAELERKIDAYHDNVQVKVPQILREVQNDGTDTSIVCGYGISVIPVTTVTDSQGDMLIDTVYASLGATVAPFGGELESGDPAYTSADMQVDASTCAFPDITWFVKYQDHNNFCDPYKEFILWLVQYDGQPTIASDAAYPQYLVCIGHQYLKPVTADDVRVSKTMLQVIIDFFKKLLEKVFGGFSLPSIG